MPCALNIHNVDVLITKDVVLCHQCHGLSLTNFFMYYQFFIIFIS